MADNTFQIITYPAPDNVHITTRPKYRGTKTQAQTYAEITTRLAGAPPTVENVIRTLGQVVIDWTITGWKIDPLGDDLISFLCGCGGSSLVGQPTPNTFDDLGIELHAHYGDAGRVRAQAAFQVEKVGEQNRVSPVFIEVYDSQSKSPNHYVAGKGLTIILGNRRALFDPNNQSHLVRFQKADGTWVVAAGYPYVKGSTIVGLPPAGLTGQVTLELTLEINGSLRTGVYPFPLS